MTFAPKQVGKVLNVATFPANGLAAFPALLGVGIEGYRTVIFNQTNAGASVALPTPGVTTVMFGIDIVNKGTKDLLLIIPAMLLKAGTTVRMTWDGANWKPAQNPNKVHFFATASAFQTDSTTQFQAGDIVVLTQPNSIFSVDLTRIGYLAAAFTQFNYLDEGAAMQTAAQFAGDFEPNLSRYGYNYFVGFAASTTNINISQAMDYATGAASNVAAPNAGTVLTFTLVNTRGSAVTATFDATYFDSTGLAALGAVSVAAQSSQTVQFERIYGTTDKWVQKKAVANINATLIDSSTAAQTITLPAATASGEDRFYVNKAITNTATLAVAAGDSLNGVLNGTFTFSNYPAGTQFIVTDYDAGKWVVAVEGASTQTALSYGVYTGGTATNDAAGDHVRFNKTGTIEVETGGNITLDTTSAYTTTANTASVGRFTLKAGKRYRLEGMIKENSGATWLGFAWYNADTNAQVGTYGGSGSGSSIDVNVTDGPSIAIVSPTVDTRYELRKTGETSAVITFFGNSNLLGTYAVIEELPSATAVLAGMVTPNALSYCAGTTSAQTGLPGVGNRLGFNVNQVTVGSNILHNTSNGIIRLLPGKTYKLTGSPNWMSIPGGGFVSWQWYNITGATLLGNNGAFDAQNNTNIVNGGPVVAFIAPVVSTQVEFRQTGGAGTLLGSTPAFPWFTVEELPIYSVVNPDTVPVTTLAHGTVDTITDGQSTTSAGAWVDVTNGGFTLPNIGTYDVVYSVSSNNNTVGQATLFRIVKTSDSSEVTSSYSTVSEANGGGNTGANTVPVRITTASAGEAYKLQWRVSGGQSAIFNNATLTGAGGRSSIRYSQLPVATVIDTGSITVTDNTGTGYFDVGNMRMQWGRFTTTAVATQTVALPAAFANTGFAVTVSSAVSGTSLIPTDVLNASASTFTFIQRVSNTAAASAVAGRVFNWIAIGQKP